MQEFPNLMMRGEIVNADSYITRIVLEIWLILLTRIMLIKKSVLDLYQKLQLNQYPEDVIVSHQINEPLSIKCTKY